MALKYSKKYQQHQRELKSSLKKVKEQFFAALKENPSGKKLEKEVIFTTEFLTLLKEALPSPSEFLSMTMQARKKVAGTIQNLLLVESNWKGLVTSMHHEHRLIQKMFPKQLNKFCKDSLMYFSPGDRVTHKQQREAHPSHKTVVFCKNLFKFMKDKKIPFFKKFMESSQSVLIRYNLK